MQSSTAVFRSPIFGGYRPWSPHDWTAQDDQVRGGSSYSILDCSPSSPTAVFHGNLDIHTLGGAGFASQRTTGADRHWDLSDYDGIELQIGRSDEKRYTLTLKDTIPGKRPDGRDESGVSWEYDFRPAAKERVFVKWSDFKPTYRGKECPDAKPLELGDIKRMSLMMRSFFGEQEGDFFLEVESISVVVTNTYRDESDDEWVAVEKYDEKGVARRGRGFFSWMLESCGLL